MERNHNEKRGKEEKRLKKIAVKGRGKTKGQS